MEETNIIWLYTLVQEFHIVMSLIYTMRNAGAEETQARNKIAESLSITSVMQMT